MDAPPKTVSILYERSKDAPYIPVSGVAGGPSVDRTQIVVHLFLEHPVLPSYVHMKPNEEGQYDPSNGEVTSRGDWVRQVQATAVMSPEAAISIGKWLIERGNAYLTAHNTEPDQV